MTDKKPKLTLAYLLQRIEALERDMGKLMADRRWELDRKSENERRARGEIR